MYELAFKLRQDTLSSVRGRKKEKSEFEYDKFV